MRGNDSLLSTRRRQRSPPYNITIRNPCVLQSFKEQENIQLKMMLGEFRRRTAIRVGIPQLRFLSTEALPFTDIPQPPHADSKQYDQVPAPSHVEFLMMNGGPTKIHQFMDAMYGLNDVMRYRMPGNADTLLLFDPDEMFKVHKACGSTPVGSTVASWPFMVYYDQHLKRPAKVKPLSFTTDPAAWKVQRHAMQKGIFGFDEAKSYVPFFSGAVKEGVASFSSLPSDEFFPFVNRLTFEVIHCVLFGTRAYTIDPKKANPIDIKFVNSTIASFLDGGSLFLDPRAQLIQFIGKMPKEYTDAIPKEAMDLWHRFIQSVDNIVEIGAEKVSAVLANPESAKNEFGVECATLRYARDPTITREELIIDVVGLFQGGVDTTANSVLWALTRLAQNPEAQEIVRQEIRGVNKRREANWNADQLTSLKMLSSFFEEAMRFGPTAIGHSRVTSDDCEIKSHRTGKTFKVPKGTFVMFCNKNLKMDPSLVKDANVFKADRYTRECKHARRGTPEAKIDSQVSDVFSFGPRMCIGARLAKIELMNILAETLDQYKVELEDPKQEFSIVNSFLTRPDPLPKFKFTKI